MVIFCLPQLELSASEATDTIPPKLPARELDLDEVVVSAQRAPVFRHELMRVVQLIQKADIGRFPGQDISGLLQHQRGIDVRRRGAPGMQADIGIRGGTFDQTMVLVNGVNLSDPQTGHHVLNLPVGLDAIERIEILHGPGARLFGPNAFSGAINVITKAPEQTMLQLSTQAGEYGFGRASLTAGIYHGSRGKAVFRHLLSGGAGTSKGYIENTDYMTADLYYRLITETRALTMDVQAGYTHKAFGANSFYSPRFPEQFEEIHARFASIKVMPQSLPGTHFSAYWRRHNDRFELFRHEAPDWYTGHNHHMTDVAGVTANYRLEHRYGVSSLGMDYRYEHIYSNVLGIIMEQPISVKKQDAFYTHQYDRSGLSILAEHTLVHSRMSFSAGVLAYMHTDLKGKIELFPGLDAGYRISDSWQLFVSVNRTLRLPTFTDLFYSGPTNLGNPELLPEHALSAEGGIRLQKGQFSLDAGLFRRWGKQMIDWVRYPGSEQWLSMNHTSVNISGFEMGGTWSIIHDIRGSYQVMALNRPSLRWAYALTHVDKLSGDMVSNYALDHLRHKIDIGLSLPIGKHIQFSTLTSWRDRAGSYIVYDGNTFTDTVEFLPYWVIDIRLMYRTGRFDIHGDVTNLLNTRIVDIANVPLPGRWIVFGLNTRIFP